MRSICSTIPLIFAILLPALAARDVDAQVYDGMPQPTEHRVWVGWVRGGGDFFRYQYRWDATTSFGLVPGVEYSRTGDRATYSLWLPMNLLDRELTGVVPPAVEFELK